MKTYLIALTLLFALNGFSQKNDKIKLSKEKINAAKTIYDLISDIPKGCPINTWKFSAAVKGSFKEWAVKGPGLTSEIRAVIQTLGEKGSFSVENISSGCSKSHRNKYTFVNE